LFELLFEKYGVEGEMMRTTVVVTRTTTALSVRMSMMAMPMTRRRKKSRCIIS
jgi:hypothetical protein